MTHFNRGARVLVKRGIVEELVKIVGREDILTEDFELLPYARDHQMVRYSSFFKFKPEVVVLPENSGEVAKIVQLANREKIPVTPRGGGTGMTGNAVPLYGGILLDMKRMNRILEIDKENMCVRVQAGCNLEKLDKELRRHGFICGHDPASRPSAVVGGAVATDGVGSRSQKYGNMRDQVIALEVVLPTGELIKVGGGIAGKAPKTSVGYGCLKYIFIGQWGTLGVITEVTLKVFPTPEKIYCTSVAFKKFSDAIKVGYNIMMKDIPVSSIGICDKHFIAIARKMGPKCPYPADAKGIMNLTFEGAKEVVEASVKRALKICKRGGGRDLGPQVGKADWEARHDFFPMLTSMGPGMWQDEECAVPYSYAEQTLEFIHKTLKKYNIDDWGGEIFTIIPLMPSVQYRIDERNEKKWQDYERATKEIAAFKLRVGGSVSSCHGLGTRRLEDLLPIELGDKVYKLMKKIKMMLDPNNIMNPGRWGLDAAYEE